MLMCQNETCITKFDTNNMHARYPCCSIECFREWENDLNHKNPRMMESPKEQKVVDNFERECHWCKAPYRKKRFFKDCYPCCSLQCFEEWKEGLSRKAIQEVKDACREMEFERFKAIEGMERQKQLDSGGVADSGIKTPSLKDFIGKECSIFNAEGDSVGWKGGDTVGDAITFVYMGSDDACHIIQRKEDGEPDGIFFFPKAAVALRF